MSCEVLFERKHLVRKSQKAQAAADLGRVALDEGLPRDRAADLTAHELAHALSLEGNDVSMHLARRPALLGYRLRASCEIPRTEWEEMSSEQQINAYTSPSRKGSGLSGSDLISAAVLSLVESVTR